MDALAEWYAIGDRVRSGDRSVLDEAKRATDRVRAAYAASRDIDGTALATEVKQ